MTVEPPSGTKRCPECGSVLGPDAPSGNCPACLLKVVASFGPGFTSIPATSQPEPANGQIGFGDYELLQEIARGGMGIVYRARQKSLNREVAVKVMLSGQFASDAFIKRFQSEAAAAAALRHPNIVAIHEIGRQAGQYFFSMDYVRGTDLAERIRQRPLAPREAAKCLKTIAEAVDYAHENGILHRDLKPSNILLDGEGEPRITDFGLAKRIKEDSELTLTGQLLGSPNYMSPEQANGVSELMPASDIYALGAILYHALSGRPPFVGETLEMVLQQTMHSQPIALRALVTTIPVDLETICLKCLRTDPARRYHSAKELADDLGRFLEGQPIAARPASPAYKFWLWCRRRPGLATLSCSILVLLVALAVGSNIAATRIATEAKKTSAEAERAVKAERETTEKLWLSYLSLARANRFSKQPGQRLLTLDVLAKAARIRPSMALRNEAIAAMALPDVRVVQERPPRFPDLAPHSIVFTPDMQTYAEAIEGGRISIRHVADNRELKTIRANRSEVEWLEGFSPDGKFLYATYASSKGTLMDVLTGAVLLQGLTGGSFSADGKLFAAIDTQRFPVIYDLASLEEVVQLPQRVSRGQLCFHPSNRILAYRPNEESIFILEIPTGQALAEVCVRSEPGFSWSRDGKRLAIPGLDGYGYVWNLETHELRKTLQSHGRRMTRIAFSNNGELLASTSWDDNIRLWEAASGAPVFALPGSSYQMQFSPDDHLLAFVARNSGRVGLVEITAHPEYRSIQAFDEPHQNDFLAVSPDGQWIATGSAQGPGIRLIQLQTGKEITALPERLCFAVAFSHEGDRLLAATDDGVTQWSFQSSENNSSLSIPDFKRLMLPLPPGNSDVRVGAADKYIGVINQREEKAFVLNPLNNEVTMQLPHSRVKHLDMSSDGRWLATSPRHGSSIKVWDLANSKVVKEFPAATGKVLFSPDSRWLVTSTKGYKIYETGTWKEGPQIRTAEFNPDACRMSFSADGKLLAVQLGNKGIQLLQMPKAETVAMFEPPDLDQISRFVLSPDGHHLIMLTLLGELKIWDLRKIREHLQTLGLDWNQQTRQASN